MQRSDNEELIAAWKSNGFTEEHVFKDEYTLLINRKTLECVRIYLDGSVWLKGKTGTYRRMN